MKRSKRWLVLFCMLWCGGVAHAVLPTTWSVRTSGVSNRLNAITYGNGLFVAAGASPGQVLFSPEGINWSSASTPVTNGWFWGAAYGAGRYVLVGDVGAFIRSSADGIHWTNGSAAASSGASLRSVVYAHGQFVAVGCAPQYGPYVLTSSNGINWTSQSVPGNTPLSAVCASSPPSPPMYIAVGSNGIFSSTNGTNWALQSLGTFSLHDAQWHQGRFIVTDTSSASFSSSDGISWSAAAPPSFTVEDLDSSGPDGALVAVGYYSGWGGEGYSGRIQASVDGLTWPGNALQFTPALRGVAYGGNSFVAVGENGTILQSFVGPMPLTNEWTKATSGDWDESYWSLGVLPSADHQAVAIRNSGWKAVAIGPNTTANYADSLTVNDLIIDAPTNAGSQLLLNWAGLTVPLVVRSNLIVGTNGSLAGHASRLIAANFNLRGSATFDDDLSADFGRVIVGVGGYWANNRATILITSNLTASGNARMDQNAGIVAALGGILISSGTYNLTNGTLFASGVGLVTDFSSPGTIFNQYGGTADFDSLALGVVYGNLTGAVYKLSGGNLTVHGPLSLINSGFIQEGGTNVVGSSTLGGTFYHKGDGSSSGYSLSGGELREGSTLLDKGSRFFQNGGNHIVTNQLAMLGREVEEGALIESQYLISNGLFSAGSVYMRWATLEQDGGDIRIENALHITADNDYPHQYRSYIYLTGGTLFCSNLITSGSGADMLQSGGAVIVSDTLVFSGWYYGLYMYPYADRYSFMGGTLTASNIDLRATFSVYGTNISKRIANPGWFKLSGTLELINTSLPIEEQLGRFILADNSTIFLRGTNNILRFAPSAGEMWATGVVLRVTSWTGLPGGGGTEQLIFGTNQFGLTSSQLSQITFVDPAGWPQGSYSARLLPTGELVPAVPPPLAYTNARNALVLYWPSGYDLVSATNVVGPYNLMPGATSPWTNQFIEAQRYFRLRLPAP